MSGLVNKVKEVLHGDKHGDKHTNTHTTNNTQGNNIPEGTHGPHGSKVANAADPRVDSDLDSTRRTAGHGEFGSNNNYATQGTGTSNLEGSTGYGNEHGIGRTTGATGTSGYGNEQGIGGTTAGFGNEQGIGRTAGTTGYGNEQGMGRTAGTGMTGTEGAYESGPRTTGHHHGVGSGITGTHDASTGTYGSQGLERDGRDTYGAGTGPGPAPHTAGPHKNDMLNKADPRVDSNMDGSRTVGGNKTFQ